MSALDYQPSSLLNAYPNIAPSTSRDSTPTADQTPSEHSETDEGLPGFESPNFCANQLHYYQKTGEWPPGWNYTATLPGLKPIYVDSDEEVEKAEKKEQGVVCSYYLTRHRLAH